LTVEVVLLLGVVGFECDDVKDLVDGVVGTHDPDVADDSSRKVEVLEYTETRNCDHFLQLLFKSLLCFLTFLYGTRI
jgi:hypothetical protein